MEMPVVLLGEHRTGVKLRPYDEGRPAGSSQDFTGPGPLQSLMHFPKESSYTVSPDFFEFSFLRHKKYSLILAVLSGCTEGALTVGITLCRGSNGLLKRVHYPTRFLIPKDWTFWSPFHRQTLHISLSGNEILLKPLIPAWTRCLVRIPDLTGSPYSISHTIPAMAPDAENCWYLNRWSEAQDRVTMTTQPCFSLHQAKVGRAIVFRHRSEPELSFRLIFSIWSPSKVSQGPAALRPLNLCVKAEVGERVLEPQEGENVDGTPDRQIPSPRRRFVIGGRVAVVVKFRKSQQQYTLAIVQISELQTTTAPLVCGEVESGDNDLENGLQRASSVGFSMQTSDQSHAQPCLCCL
jgi:hypothetical protein